MALAGSHRDRRSHLFVLPSGGAAAARRRHRAKQHRGYIGREKSGLLRVTAYILPAASRDTARRAWEIPSCYYPQAKLKLMGGVSIVKVMVGGGRRSIRAPAELGPGEITLARMKTLDGGRAAKMQRDEAGTGVGNRVCRATEKH